MSNETETVTGDDRTPEQIEADEFNAKDEAAWNDPEWVKRGDEDDSIADGSHGIRCHAEYRDMYKGIPKPDNFDLMSMDARAAFRAGVNATIEQYMAIEAEEAAVLAAVATLFNALTEH
jgi:hypothetical protein